MKHNPSAGKYIRQIKKGDTVRTHSGKLEEVESIRFDENDPRIAYIKTASGEHEANANGILK